VIVSKVGANRNDQGHWVEAQRPDQLRAGVLENLASLELDQVPVVNLRRHPEGDVGLDEQIDAMVALREEGLIGGIGISNVSLEEYRTATANTAIACVQNAYNLANRSDQAVFDACRSDGVPYVPFFPLGSGFSPDNPVLGAPAVKEAAQRLGASPAQVALAWVLHQAPTTLLIPGTSSLKHLEENLAAADLVLDPSTLDALSN
jgi:pyridoxine 4-dehydrogenase